ncbi:MAG: tRNA pseudouridine(55) synthase TruB [Bryobacterales bacterium]|nr:tRNA pseudouridine(55) synthase TruB [Bryobacterales bacterium]MBV9398422.1 tRNA pseudouridine(55) synthase TruB [Bryobacterales bacterium]
MDGVIVVDKPADWTSHDVVNKTRRFAGTRRVGHLGTLDPSATGVLPLVIGRATRLAQFYTRNDKTYEGVVHFGFSTNTYDAAGQRTSDEVAIALDPPELEPVLDRFRGAFEQVPPPVSAKKVGGRPAYELARKQQAVELKPVPVEVYSLELLRIEGCEVELRVHCSAGTYLRSIAHEAGQALGCGAFLKSLRRTASGDFRIESAHTLEQLAALADEGRLADVLIPAAELLPEFPAEMVDSITAGQIRNGRDFRVSPFQARKGARYVKAVTPQGDLVAIGEARLPHLYHPVLVL